MLIGITLSADAEKGDRHQLPASRVLSMPSFHKHKQEALNKWEIRRNGHLDIFRQLIHHRKWPSPSPALPRGKGQCHKKWGKAENRPHRNHTVAFPHLLLMTAGGPPAPSRAGSIHWVNVCLLGRLLFSALRTQPQIKLINSPALWNIHSK